MVSYGAVATVVIGLAAGAMWVLARAKVEGDTPAERIASIGRLADERPPGAADAIAAAAGGDPDASVRQAALVVLGRFVHPKYRAMVEAGIADKDPRVRAGAARTLGLYRDDRAADSLGKLAGEAPEEEVRMAAVAGLGHVNRPRAIVHLVRIMETDGDPAVQLEALHVMMRNFKVRFRSPPDPRNAAAWQMLLGKVRKIRSVREALKGAEDSEQQR